MLCPSCHSELSPGVTTCPSCRTPLIPQTPTFVERTAVHDPPMMTDGSIHQVVSPDESIPNIEDVSTKIYEVDYPADEQTYVARTVPTADEQTFIDNTIPTNAEGSVLQSTPTNEDIPTLKVAAVTASPLAYSQPIQTPVADENRSATPRSNPSQALPTGTGARGGRLSTSMLLIAVLVIFAALLVIENGGIVVYGAVYLPAQTNARATVAAQPQATVEMQATSSAQQMKTAQAQTTVLAQQFSQAQTTADQQPNVLYTQSTNGTKVFDDPLNNPNTSVWFTQQFNGGSCAFNNGAYHAVSNNTNTFVDCDLLLNLKNFAFQVQMTITTGDEGGLIFHDNISTNQFYYLEMDAATGDYRLHVYTDNNADHAQMLQSGFMPTFKIGNNQTNLVTIIAKGNNFYIYINKQIAFYFTDSKYSNGILALIAADATKNTDVAFSNAQLWLLLN